jgi:hypothetical protein
MALRVRAPAAATVAAVAFLAAAVLPGATWPLVDGDVWWHIRAGREIVATGRVPDHDTWSLAGSGREWISQDWLANVALAAAHGLGEWGPTLLSLTFGLLVVATFALLFAAVRLHGRGRAGPLATTAWLALGLLVAGPVLGVRVQVVDLTLTAVVVWVLWRYLADRRRRWLAALPAVAAVWVNLHAGFPLLFLAGGGVVVGEVLDRLLGRRAGEEPLAWRQIGELGVALAVAAAALALNPNGVAMYGYPLYTLGIGSLGAYILEWSRPDPATLPGQLLAVFVCLAVVPTLLFARSRLRTADALMLVGLTAMSLLAVRFVLVAGPIGSAIAAATLTPVLAETRIGRRLTAIGASLGRAPAGGRAAVNVGLCVVVVVLGTSVAFARVAPSAQRTAISEEAPVAAVRWIVEHEPGATVFNRYEWGGYLGFVRPGEPVFIDGRADVYGDAIIRRYAQTILLEIDPRAELDRYGVDAVLFSPNSALARWLDAAAEWRRAYSDAVAAVWVRR